MIYAVEGYLAQPEFDYLQAQGAQAALCIVEIGSYRGRSTIALALQAHVPVYAIEPHDPFTADDGTAFDGGADRAAFLRNILDAGVAERVHLVNLPSVQAARAWTRPIDLLWVDGDHRPEAVEADVRAWLPFVVPGGSLLLHDIHAPGVEYVCAALDQHDEWEVIPSTVPIAHYRRRNA